MSFFCKAVCKLVGHTWDRIIDLRTRKTIGYQCAHCGQFKPYRPSGLLDRYFE